MMCLALKTRTYLATNDSATPSVPSVFKCPYTYVRAYAHTQTGFIHTYTGGWLYAQVDQTFDTGFVESVKTITAADFGVDATQQDTLHPSASNLYDVHT